MFMSKGIYMTADQTIGMIALAALATISVMSFAIVFWEGERLSPIYNLTSFKGAECVESRNVTLGSAAHSVLQDECTAKVDKEWTSRDEECLRTRQTSCFLQNADWAGPRWNDCRDKTYVVCTLYQNAHGLTADPELAKKLGLEVVG